MPLYIGTGVAIALLALASAFVRTRGARPSTQVSAPHASPPGAVAQATTEQVGGGLSLALAEPAPEPAPREPIPAVEANESKTRPVRRQASLRRSGSHQVGSLNVITTLRGEPYWASVLIDGVHRGNTPLNVELSPGKHRIHLERAGFRSVDRQIKIASGRPGVLRVELVP
jgi:hypothetical protein